MLQYLDVTSDPAAPARSGVSAGTIADLEARGATALGWAAFTFGRHATVSWVGKTVDGRAIVALWFWQGREMMGLRTLGEDGRVVVTEERPRGWLRLRLGLAPLARHDWYFAAPAIRGDFDALLAFHEARVRELEIAPVRHVDVATYNATRLRYGECSRARTSRGNAIRDGLGRAFSVVLSAGFIAASIASWSALEGWAILTALAGALVAAESSWIGKELGAWYIGPLFARKSPAPARRPASALIAEARALEPAPLPKDDRVRLPANEMARVRRIDAVVSYAACFVVPAIGLVVTLRGGLRGALVVAGAFMVAEGASVLLMKRGLLEVVRTRLLPSLVRAEQAASRERDPGDDHGRSTAALLVVGTLMLAWTRAITTSPAAPIWCSAMWVVLALSLVAVTAGDLRSSHDEILPLETESPRGLRGSEGSLQ